MKTFNATAETVEQDWFLVNGENKTLGRLASDVAHRLRGKHKAEYTPHVDTGDYIVVINADKLRVSGKKTTDKVYYTHSQYPGGLSETTFQELQDKAPGRAFELAVKGMLPKNPLGRAMAKKLKVYAGSNHPHSAQQPKELNI